MALSEIDGPRPKDPFEKNRKVFFDLIYSMEQFTAEEIMEEYRNERTKNGIEHIAIDGRQTATELLEELVEIGVLSKEDNVFAVVYHPVD